MILAALDHPDTPSIVHVFRSGVDCLDEDPARWQTAERLRRMVKPRRMVSG